MYDSDLLTIRTVADGHGRHAYSTGGAVLKSTNAVLRDKCGM